MRVQGRPDGDRRTARITRGDEVSATLIFPATNSIRPANPSSTTPTARSASRIAPSGHAQEQPPHPLHNSGKTCGFPANITIPLNRQMEAQCPQDRQRPASITGTGTVTRVERSIFGFRKRWAFGSSTSQSRNRMGPGAVNAKLTATVVLPVPPFPEAMTIDLDGISPMLIAIGISDRQIFPSSMH